MIMDLIRVVMNITISPLAHIHVVIAMQYIEIFKNADHSSCYMTIIGSVIP